MCYISQCIGVLVHCYIEKLKSLIGTVFFNALVRCFIVSLLIVFNALVRWHPQIVILRKN